MHWRYHLGSLMRASLALKLCPLLAVAFTIPANLMAQTDTSLSPLPVFEFHSGFWLNLHHTLYHQARLQRSTSSPASVLTNLSSTEQKTWDAAVAYYSQTYA